MFPSFQKVVEQMGYDLEAFRKSGTEAAIGMWRASVVSRV
jgi:hypothetical protein